MAFDFRNHGARLQSIFTTYCMKILTPDRPQVACGDDSLKTWRYISTNRPIRLHTGKQPISERKSPVDIYIKDSKIIAYIGNYKVGLFQALDKGADLKRKTV